MSSNHLQEYTARVTLSVGDIIIDTTGRHTGILVTRRRHIDMVEDDIYIWEIKWNNNVMSENDPFESPMSSILEEESLKLSIVVGIYEWHSVNGETFEV
jgi:hypothetical protein